MSWTANVIRGVAFAALIGVVVAAPAAAQVRGPVGLRAYGFYEGNQPLATNTFTGVLGTSRIFGVGGGGEVLRVWNGVFLRVAASSTTNIGSRVAVYGDQAISLHEPLTVEMRPVEFGGGWRFDGRRFRGRRRPQRAVAYFGGSVVRLRYRETSVFADTGEDVDTSFTGFAAFGGVDLSFWSWMMVGVEAEYRSLPNAIGTGGASQAFGESNLGASAIRVMFGIRR